MMSSKKIRVLALVGVSGMACSLAMAQSGDILPTPQTPHAKSSPQHGTPVPVVRTQTIDPIGVRVNGKWVPFTLIKPQGGGTDSNAISYDNITATTGNVVVPTPPANVVFPQFALDDVTLAGAAGPRRLTGVRVAFATQAVVANPLTGMGVDVIWYQNLSPTSSPVESGNKLDVFIAFANPASPGWAVNTTYTATQFAFFADGPIISSSGALEMVMYNQGGTALSTDFTPAYSTGGTIGTSTSSAWLDQNGNNDYDSNEQVTLTNGNGNVNLRVALETEEVNASPTGRCCLANSNCVILTSAECTTTLGGIYGGDGTKCAGNCATLPVLWSNGPLSTGVTTVSGTSAATFTGDPLATWSEFPSEAGCTINTFGLSANITGTTPFRLADDFFVPPAEEWNVQSVTVYSYVTGGSTITPSLSNIVLRIVQNDPVAGPTVWGDTFTNVLTTPATQGVFTHTFRIASSQAAAGNILSNRGIWSYNIPVGINLAPGHYYIDYGDNAGFVPMVTLMGSPAAPGNGVRQIEGANGRQFLGGTFNLWTYMGTGGGAAAAGTTGCIATTSELPFRVSGSKPCYANCDGSTVAPVLNANDFQCFLNAFAGSLLPGMPADFANCDASTAPPVLNANDFQCFLNAFAAGCPT